MYVEHGKFSTHPLLFSSHLNTRDITNEVNWFQRWIVDDKYGVNLLIDNIDKPQTQCSYNTLHFVPVFALPPKPQLQCLLVIVWFTVEKSHFCITFLIILQWLVTCITSETGWMITLAIHFQSCLIIYKCVTSSTQPIHIRYNMHSHILQMF